MTGCVPMAASGAVGQRGKDDRVGERQRQTLGIEDVGVEQMRRIGEQLVQDPADPPDREQRVSVIGHGVRRLELVVNENRQRDRDAERCQRDTSAQASGRTHVKRFGISGETRGRMATSETRRRKDHCVCR